MARFMHLLFLLSLLINLAASVIAQAVYNVADFGAIPDGQNDVATVLLDAWTAACRSGVPVVTVYVPAGFFLVSHVTFHGPCSGSRITLQIDGALVKLPGFYTAGEWIVFEQVEGVSVFGGTINGRGSSLWECKMAGGKCPNGATSLTFRNSKEVLISGLTSIDSELYHMVIDGCRDVMVQSVEISTPPNSPNTDGIHVQASEGVTIFGAGIGTGDDCVSVGPGTTGLWIERVTCGPGHGISIGSLGKGYREEGVENVTVRWTELAGTENGLRIKTWGRPSAGYVREVAFEHVLMRGVNNPIIIDQDYCAADRRCPGQNSGVKISEVKYRDIRGSSATQVAVKFDCSASNPCRGIELEDIKLTFWGGRPAEASCRHAAGTASGLVVPPSCL